MTKYFNSKNILVLISVIITCLVFYPPIPQILSWDIFGHYVYLPLIFENNQIILNDLSYVESVDKIYDVSPAFYQFVATESGHYYTKYTGGWAILMTPFYLIAEFWASLADYPADGFSYPYQLMMYIGNWFYEIVGLIYIRKILLHFFSDKQAATLLVLLIFSTNLLWMYYGAIGQSHLLALSMLSIFLYNTIKFYQSKTIKQAFVCGIFWGLLTLVRPPDGIFGLLFFLWPLTTWKKWSDPFSWFQHSNRNHFIFMITAFILVIFPQALYWFLSSGSWLLNSYANNPGEGFNFSDPFIFEFLFSFRKGWFIYTPFMLLAIIGMYKFSKLHPQGRIISAIILIFTYIASSWSCWWYGASYSSRAMVDCYVLCILPAGYFLMTIQRTTSKILLAIFVVATTSLNLFQTYQFSSKILNHSFMTRDYYFSTLFQVNAPSKEQKKLLHFDLEKGYREGFKKNEQNYSNAFTLNTNFNLKDSINSANPYLEILRLETNDYVLKSHVWIKVTYVMSKPLPTDNKLILYTTMSYKDRDYSWQGFTPTDCGCKNKATCDTLVYYYLTPNIRSDEDDIIFGAMNDDESSVHFKSRTIEFFEPITDYK
ncbi:MAG: hypothetical protein IPM74_08680 [Crocinitomicaceae bacterium]|nr:hypothetical protein [Crocinitomicaceae bacterium]MBK8925964.1 hypothetical protein [Crocinitomicaceae bacterium]